MSDARSFFPEDLDESQQFCNGATDVALDAPAKSSTNPPGIDEGPPTKFRPTRCCEVASLKVTGVPAVPWVTPLLGAEMPGWMQTGFGIW